MHNAVTTGWGSNMKRKTIAVAALLALPLLYVGLPLWAAWDLRASIKAADAGRLGPRVAWTELRENLKQRIVARADQDSQQGGWVRRQATRLAAPTVAGRTVDFVVTPERLSWLLKRRLDWRAVRLDRPDAKAPPPTPPNDTDDDDPLSLEPRRLKWAFFETPTTFRIEVRDKNDPKRTLVARLGLRGLTWQLIDVAVLEPRV